MSKTFYLSKDGEHVGPFSSEDILQKIQKKELKWVDYVFDGDQQDWILILEHPVFAKRFNSGWGRPDAIPMTIEPRPFMSAEQRKKEKEWFVLRGENNYGPYSYLEVIQMLQEKHLFEYDYVWHQELPAWRRIAEVPEFKPEAIKNLKNSGDHSVAEIFFRRRHARARYGCSLILHDNKSVYKGHSVEISAGGAGIIIGTQVLQPGQTVFLHFQPGDGVPPFNAICSVVSKQFVKGSPGQPVTQIEVKYGVKFTSISQNVRESIKSFAEAKSESKAA